ncbi:MAG: N-acetyl-gamma-glutamyl-phosphate reductase [Bacteroidota bacterium]
MPSGNRVAILHGAGYAGGELIRLLLHHPLFELVTVTSRSFAGQPVWAAHPKLRGLTDLHFTTNEALDAKKTDALFIAAEHGQCAAITKELLARGYAGKIVDLSADFRLRKKELYNTWYGFDHPAPDLLDSFVYGMAEIATPYPDNTRFIANPGCFATGISLALSPALNALGSSDVTITALTGASGSGATPKTTTHYPTREGNVRAYKVLRHQHLGEIYQLLGDDNHLAFTPVSGPWVRGIWGMARIKLPSTLTAETVSTWYQQAYEARALVRLWPGALPELRVTVETPFCDIGWIVEGNDLVIGFAIDNLLKGAASQAVQNLNLISNLPETLGLLPETTKTRTNNGYARNYQN